MNATLKTECRVSTSNETGVGAAVAECLSSANVNLLAFCGYGGGNEAVFLFVPDDPDKACAALSGAGFECTKHEVVFLETEHRPGALAAALRRIADAGIVLDYVYATTSQHATATCVIRAADPAAAVAALAR